MKRLLILILLLFLGAVLWPGPAAAQEPIKTGLNVSPAIIEVLASPGETYEHTFYIRNITSTAVPVSASLDRLKPNEEELDITDIARFDASAWIHLSEEHHILEVDQQRAITATVQIPADAEPGGHYATIWLDPVLPQGLVDQTGAKAAPRIGILVFITVKGDAAHQLAALQPQIDFINASATLSFGVKINNSGSVHEVPTAKMVVKNIFGATKGEIVVAPRIVLPNTQKSFSLSWQAPAWFGIYKAHIEATYGSDQQFFSGPTRYFVVIQWLPAIILLLILPALTVFVLKTHRRWPAAYRAFVGPRKHSRSKRKSLR